MKRTILVIFFLVAMGSMYWVLAGKPTMRSKPTAGNEPTPKSVTYVNGGFVPDRLDLKLGETVTFINGSESPMEPALGRHPDHGKYPGFPEQPLKPGEHFSFKFTAPGKWDYHDHLEGHNSAGIYVSNTATAILATLPAATVPQSDGYYRLTNLGIRIKTTPDLIEQELLAVASPNSPDTIFITTRALKDAYPWCNGFNGAIATLTRMKAGADSTEQGAEHAEAHSEHTHGVFMKDVGDVHVSYEVPYESCVSLGGVYGSSGIGLEYKANRAFYFAFIESAQPVNL